MAFDANRLKFGDLIAGGGAVVLFISLFLDWYKVEFKGFGGNNLGAASEGGNAFDALGIGPIFLLLVALAVVAIVVVRALGAAVPTLHILFRLIVLPDGDIPDAFEDAVDFKRSIGIFLGLLSALAITAGGFLSARERGEAVPGVDGGLGTGAGGGPLGGGQPAAGGPLGGGAPGAGAPAAGAGPVGGATATAPAAQTGGTGGNPAPDWYED